MGGTTTPRTGSIKYGRLDKLARDFYILFTENAPTIENYIALYIGCGELPLDRHRIICRAIRVQEMHGRELRKAPS